MNLKYIGKKIISCLIVLFVVITLNFFLPRLIFSDPATPYYAGIPEDAIALRAAVRAEYGFDKPLIVQYFMYLGRIFTFNFGTSYIYKEPVFKVMFSRIPWSLVLTFTSMIISVLLGVVIGAMAAKNRGKWQDNTLLKVATVTTALPTFWLAMVFVMLLAFTLPIFPYSGALTSGYALSFNKVTFFCIFGGAIALTIGLYLWLKKGFLVFTVPIVGMFLAVIFAVPVADTLDVIYHAALPVFVISIGSVVSYALLVRNSMIAVTNEDYILTARAKGLPPNKILFRHTFRNALLPLVTNLGLSIAGMFGGSVLIEKIFSWPGMGQLLLEANNAGDFQLAQAIMLFFAIITIIANLITDLIYHKLDPRVGAA